MARLAALLLLLAALAGCGETTVRQEPSITVTGGDEQRDEAPGIPAGEDAPRIAVVTHGQASSPFWAIVRTGVEAAERQMNVQVDYEAPDVYSLSRMIELVDEAVASKPDGLVVSFPEPGLAPAIRRAVRAGIPVITINSGSDAFRSLGVLAHVGQPEGRAGLAAGRRLARAGVRRALCVNQQVGNVGLDARCDGLARHARGRRQRARARHRRPEPETPDKIAAAVTSGNDRRDPRHQPGRRTAAVEAVASTRRRPKVAAFDLGPTPCGPSRRASSCSPSTSSPTSRATSRWSCSPTGPATASCPPRETWSPPGANFVTRENAAQALGSASARSADLTRGMWRVACHVQRP